VYSLTTLATPHHGSYNADLRVLLKDHASDQDLRLTPEQYLLSKYAPWTKTSTRDLTADAVGTFNSTNHLPSKTTVFGQSNKIYYYETWGDANLDGSCRGLSAGQPCDSNHLPTISKASDSPIPDESIGYEYPDPEFSIWSVPVRFGEILYRQVFLYKTVTRKVTGYGINPACPMLPFYVCPIKPIYGLVNEPDLPQLNDFAVTQKSALYENFIEIGHFKHNHTMMGLRDVADLIFSKIKVSQTMVQ
jgi:hypothetical protein